MTTKKELDIVATKYQVRSNPKVLIKRLISKQKDFFLRENSFMVTVIYNHKEIAFPNRKADGFKINQLWVFRSVKLDAIRFLNENPDFELPKKLPTNRYNYDCDIDDSELTGTDINSAYWNIALKLGVISENTFKMAGLDEYKVVRLAALAVLGKHKPFHRYERGVLVRNSPLIIKEPHEKLQDIYRAIRYTCYQIMDKLAVMLGNDFECYKTDCIYYRDTPENRKLVHDFLSSEGFTFKQLIRE